MYRDFRNTFIFGQPGTGKSKLLRNYIEEVIYDKTDNSEIVLIAHKDLGYRSSKITREILGNYEDEIRSLYTLFQERLAREDVRTLPRIYVFLDGLTKTFRVVSDEVKVILGEMMEKGPMANLYCVFASSSRDFDAQVLAGSTVIELK